jgi:PhnB protein
MAKVKQAIPDGLRAVTPQLVTRDATKLVEFCAQAFGAQLVHAMPGPDGKGIMHGFLRLGDCAVFVCDANEMMKATTANLMLYVPDVDATFARATAAGATPAAPVMDMFWGDRWGMVVDPFGNSWQIATHVEDLAPDEIMRRMAQAAKK